MAKYFADISSAQTDDISLFQNFINSGVSSVLIKATQGSADGDAYTNTKLLAQTRNALKVGMNVGFYHYFKASSITDSINEAKFFEQSIINLGFGKDTPLCIDAEDPSLNISTVASYVDTFISYLETRGYTKVFQYSMASWFNQGILDANKHPTWVASYGSSDCGARGNIIGWQYTSNWGGGSQDMSYDWGVFDKKITAPDEEAVIPIQTKPKVEDIIKLTETTQAVDRLGIDRPETYDKGSTWKSSDIVMINGEPHYQIATNIFVPLSKTTFKEVVIVKYVNGQSAPLFDSKGKRTVNSDVTIGKSFINGGVKVINGIPMAKIATDEYLPLEYSSGSNFS